MVLRYITVRYGGFKIRSLQISNFFPVYNYSFEINDIDMLLTLDIYNVLDNDAATTVVDNYEGIGWAAGGRNQFYGAAKTWQTPRFATLGLEVSF